MARNNPPGWLAVPEVGTMGVREDPQKVGGVYYCYYWDKCYSVLAKAGYRIKVRWEDGTEAEHCTAWDWGKDRVVSEPSNMEATNG